MADQIRIAGGSNDHRLRFWARRMRRLLAHIRKPTNATTRERNDMDDHAGIASAILRRHPGLDQGQRELINYLDGPTLGIAGSGSGKTLAVVLRGVNILLLGRARPEEPVLCTYSRAAARELRQRFIKLVTAAGCTEDLTNVRIGTIHSLCLRILRSHARRLDDVPISIITILAANTGCVGPRWNGVDHQNRLRPT